MTVEVGISDLDQWCAVSDELDELFSAAEAGGDDFAAVQASYENVRRLIAQLADGLDQVDADARQAVSNHVDDALIIATAFIEADDEEAAFAPIMDAFGPRRHPLRHTRPGRSRRRLRT